MYAYPAEIDKLIEYEATADDAPPDRRNIHFYGRNKEFFELIVPEKILYGPADTGKTMTALQFIHEMCLDHPNLNVMVGRAYQVDIAGSVFETYNNKILPFNCMDDRCPVRVYGGPNQPQKSIYATGSVIHWTGLDRGGKALSTERDIIYINECNQIPVKTWNILLTRCNGRAGNWINENGEVESMLMGDQNPGFPTDWVESRGSVEVIKSRHVDNPDLYDQNSGKLTPAGKRRLGTLELLTGPERQRLLLGKAVFASGLTFYAWHPDENVTTDADFIPGAGPVVWGVDDGYTGSINPDTGFYNPNSHPRVFLLSQIRGGKLYTFYEYHSTDSLVKDDIAAVINLRHTDGKLYPLPDWVACESAPEIKKQLREDYSLDVYSKPQSVAASVRTTNEYIGADKNGVRRWLVHPRCIHLKMEMVTNQVKPNGTPTKDFDNFLDAGRYKVWRFRDQRD